MKTKKQSYIDEETGEKYFFSHVKFHIGMIKYLETNMYFTEHTFYNHLGEYFVDNDLTVREGVDNKFDSRFRKWGLFSSQIVIPETLKHAQAVEDFLISKNIDVKILIPYDSNKEYNNIMDFEEKTADYIRNTQDIIKNKDDNKDSLVRLIDSNITQKTNKNIAKCFDKTVNIFRDNFNENIRMNESINESINSNNDDLKKEIKDIVKNNNIYRASIILYILAFMMIILALKVNPFVYGLGCIACLTWSVKLISIAKKVVLGKWWNIAFNICASAYSILFAVVLIGPDVIRIILM